MASMQTQTQANKDMISQANLGSSISASITKSQTKRCSKSPITSIRPGSCRSMLPSSRWMTSEQAIVDEHTTRTIKYESVACKKSKIEGQTGKNVKGNTRRVTDLHGAVVDDG